MLARVCCSFMLMTKSPKRFFYAACTCTILLLLLLYFTDFKLDDVGAKLLSSQQRHQPVFLRNSTRFRAHQICPRDGRDTIAAIFVHTAPQHVIRRQVIRNTWGHPNVTRQLHLAVAFLVGESDDPHVQRLVDWEAEVFGDLVQTSFPDGYPVLSYKTLAGLKWVLETCPHAMFALKTDDDIFVNSFALRKFLDGVASERDEATNSTLFCLVWHNMPVVRDADSKWRVMPDQFNSSVYPAYCSGSAYIMPMRTAEMLYNASLNVPMFWIEDVYVTGLLAKEANVGHRQIGILYAFKSRKRVQEIVDGKIVFVHLESEHEILETRMWLKVIEKEKRGGEENSTPVSIEPEIKIDT